MIRKSLFNPFSLLLLALAGGALAIDALVPATEGQSLFTPVVLLIIWFAGAVVRFSYERDARSSFDRHMFRTNDRLILTLRNGIWVPEEASALREGDVIRVGAGQQCPVDAILEPGCEVLVSEASLTGESGTEPRTGGQTVRTGSTVIDGRATAKVSRAATIEGGSHQRNRGKTGFMEGARNVCLVYVRFMVLVVLMVLAVRGALLGDWAQAALFGLGSAVGLVPEMLPMVTSMCLSGGASKLERLHVIVKDVDAMETFGDIDVICMDKTGTLTEDRAVLEYYTDVLGDECARTLDLAFLESSSHPSSGNQLEEAIRRACDDSHLDLPSRSLRKAFALVRSDPFDNVAKCSGAKLRTTRGALGCLRIPSKGVEPVLTVVKGDVERVCARCVAVDLRGEVVPLDPARSRDVRAVADEMRADGIKVLAVAYGVDVEGWNGLTLCGFLAFFDSPKRSAASAIDSLRRLGVRARVLTGDSQAVARSVCQRLGISIARVMTGSQIDGLSDEELPDAVEEVALFAELTPYQKMRVVVALHAGGHRVGFLGDGFNDLPAIQASDLGIVVDSACPEAKEAADIVLLERDLNVVAQGVMEGRRTFANVSKYLRIASSSNFGNVCSVMLASVFLPFLPATAAQLLVLNLAYDLTCMAIPSDKVDPQEISEPRAWSGRGLGSYMVTFGMVSTAFDLITFVLLLFVVCPSVCGGALVQLDPIGQMQFVGVFQAGWLLECAWTQSLVILVLRTGRRSDGCTMPGKPLALAIAVVIIAATVLLATPIASVIGVVAVPMWYVGVVAGLSLLYLVLASIVKRAYARSGGKLI